MFDWIKAAIKWLTNILGLGSKKETPPEADISTMPKDELAKKIKSFFDNDEGWENAISFRRTEWRKEADRLERGLAGREVQFLPDSYFFYLPLKERRNLIKVFTQILWRRRSQLISDPGGCLRSGTIGMSTASRITSFIREIRDRIRNFDFQKLTLFHSSRVKVRPILINVYDWVAFVFFPLQFPRDRKRLLYCTTSEELNESCGWPTESMGKGSFSLKMKSSARCTLRSTTPWSPRNSYSLSLLLTLFFWSSKYDRDGEKDQELRCEKRITPKSSLDLLIRYHQRTILSIHLLLFKKESSKGRFGTPIPKELMPLIGRHIPNS